MTIKNLKTSLFFGVLLLMN